MKKNIVYFVFILSLPFLLGFLTSRYSPWWGLREQASAPATPTNGIKFWCDSSNNGYLLNESGSNYKLNVYDPNDGLTDPTSVGTLTLGSGSITDSSGAISFGNENLATSGSITLGTGYLDGYLYRSSTDNNTAIYLRDDRVSVYSGGRVMLDSIETSQDVLYLGHDGSNDIDISMGPNAAFFLDGANSNITIKGVLRADTAKWYYCKYMDAISVSPGGSGATLTVPDSNTLGGYQLDAANEYLYFNGRACSNWDEASDVTVHVFWECYVDNTGGNAADTVDLHLECYFKGNAETTVKTQTLEEAVTIGQSAQYKQFNTSFTIDYNDGTNPIDTDDIFSFRLNLETDTSEVDNIMVNFLVFRYQTKKVHIEI